MSILSSLGKHSSALRKCVRGVGRRWMSSVGIIGMSAVGASLAFTASRMGGLHVKVTDTPDRMALGMKQIEAWIRERNDVPHEVMDRISVASDVRVVADATDFVVDAMEYEVDKRKILRVLSEAIHNDHTVATCCSDVSVTKLAQVTGKAAGQIIGLHFFNTPQESRFVEIVTGLDTDDKSLKRTKKFVEKLNMDSVVCRDSPGFISERLIIPYINEAAQVLSEGTSSREDIDKIMVLGTREAIGPLAFADHLGLDRCLQTMRYLHNRFGDDKYRPAALLVQYVDANHLGKKTGRGFYEYPEELGKGEEEAVH